MPPDDLAPRRPYGLYAELREAPPFFAEAYGVWVVSRYEDVRRVLAEHETFSSDFLIRSPLVPHPGVPEVLAAGHPEVKVLLNQDPPDHAPARAVVVGAFTPRRARELTPRVRQLAADLLDGFSTAGTADLVSAYVMPLPLYVVCELVGLPLADAARVRGWIEELSVFNDLTATPERQLAAAHSSVEFERYLAAFLDGHTGDDLTSALLASGAFDTEQMISLLITLIFGGHETTANLIGNTLLRLIPPAGDPRPWTHRSEEVAAVAITTLIERFPDLTMAPGFTGDYLPNLMHRGPARLPVRWRAA